MEQTRHNKYIQDVGALEERLKAIKINSFVLTKDEQQALERVPDVILNLHAKNLSRYESVYKDADFRDAAFQKFLAVVILEGLPVFRDAYDIGYDAGRET